MNTPRTDAEAVTMDGSPFNGIEEIVSATFARELEHELNAAKAEVDKLKVRRGEDKHVFDSVRAENSSLRAEWLKVLLRSAKEIAERDLLRAELIECRMKNRWLVNERLKDAKKGTP